MRNVGEKCMFVQNLCVGEKLAFVQKIRTFFSSNGTFSFSLNRPCPPKLITDASPHFKTIKKFKSQLAVWLFWTRTSLINERFPC